MSFFSSSAAPSKSNVDHALPIPLPTPVVPEPQHHVPVHGSAEDKLPAHHEAFEDVPLANNPGSFENMHLEARGVFANPQVFEGLKFSLMRGINPHFQVSHVLNLGSEKSDYHFSPTAVSLSKVPGAEQPSSVLLGDISNSGNMIAQVIHHVNPRLKFKFQGQTEVSSWVGAQIESEYFGKDYTAALKIVNYNPFQKSGLGVLSYLQGVTKKLSIGAELVYHGLGPRESSGLTYGLRYKAPSWIFSSTFSPKGVLQCSYFHQLDSRSLVASELHVDLMQGENVASLGFQYNMTSSIFRAQMDTNWVVSAVLEQQLAPTVAFTLCAEVNHSTGKNKFGIGLNLVQ